MIKILLALFSISSFAFGKDKKNLAFTIKGGVSLGAYEAGIIWSLSKLMNRDIEANVNYDLTAISGTSAGAINALLTGLYWCTLDKKTTSNDIYNNIFYNAWIPIGFDQLVPGDPDEYLKKDALLSRKYFKTFIDDTIAEFDNLDPNYINNCNIDLGFAVTKVKPQLMNAKDDKFIVNNQQFKVIIKMIKRNNKIEFKTYRKSTNVRNILPIIPTIEEDKLSLNDVFKFALASSAFPVVFGTVNLEHFELGQNSNQGKSQRSSFVDGGIYDNLPIKLTQRILKMKNKKDKIAHLIISADKRRDIKYVNKDDKPKENIFDLKNQLKFLGGFIESTTESSLLDLKDTNNLTLMSRYGDLWADNLAHFGAFLAKSFRRYDYFLGVYNGLYNYCKLMNLSTKTCIPQKIKLLLEQNTSSCGILSLFHASEQLKNNKSKLKDRYETFRNQCHNLVQQGKHANSQLHESLQILQIFEAISFNKDPHDSTYESYMERLRRSPFKEYCLNTPDDCSSPLVASLENQSIPFNKIIKRSLNRLIKLEEQEDEKENRVTRMVLHGAKFATNSLFGYPKGFSGSPNRGEVSGSYRFFPYEFGLNLIHGGIMFGWQPSYYFENGLGLEFQIAHHNIISLGDSILFKDDQELEDIKSDTCEKMKDKGQQCLPGDFQRLSLNLSLRKTTLPKFLSFFSKMSAGMSIFILGERESLKDLINRGKTPFYVLIPGITLQFNIIEYVKLSFFRVKNYNQTCFMENPEKRYNHCKATVFAMLSFEDIPNITSFLGNLISQ